MQMCIKKKVTWQLKSFKVHDRKQSSEHKNHILNPHGVDASQLQKGKRVFIYNSHLIITSKG
jgi:hypothetical protein